MDHLIAQGIDAYNPECNLGVAMLARDGRLSATEIMHLAGNSYHIAAITSVLMFCLRGFESRVCGRSSAPVPLSDPSDDEAADAE